MDNHLVKSINKRLLLAALLGIPFSYLITAYLENFYQTTLEIALWALLLQAWVGLFMYYLLGKIAAAWRSRSVNAAVSAVLYAALIVFVPAMYDMAKPFTTLFDADAFGLADGHKTVFFIALATALPLSAWLLSLARRKRWNESALYRFADENLHGLMAALLFFAVYLIFASIFNRPSFDADDVFFDADGNLYRWRFATENYADYYWRPAHPFILLIVRPLVGILAMLFKGDTLFAAFTLNALIGALCVFLIWYFVKAAVGNSLYALLLAAFFGASPTQLVFGSIIESYIYLSAIALIFLVFLLKDKPLYMQVIAGLVAFGITISNVGQTFIAHFFVKRNLKQIILYGLLVGAFVVPLSLLNNVIYPDSQPYFWDVSTLEGEGHNQFAPTLQRANYLLRVMTMHSFVAPEPLVIDDDFPFTKVWMFRAAIKKDPMRVASYETPLGEVLIIIWVGLMLVGGAFFIKNISRQDNGYYAAFIVTLLFYFALHMQYGKDVFLYATNWTYAILLFLALAWRELAGKRWFQIFFLVFVIFLLFNNSHMLQTMMETSAPAVPYPIWR